MKNKNNFLDELNKWKIQNNYKPNPTSPKKSKNQILNKNASFKDLNELNIMKQLKTTINKTQNESIKNDQKSETQRSYEPIFKTILKSNSKSPNKTSPIKNSKNKSILLTTRDLSSIPKSDANSNTKPNQSSSKNDKFDSTWITDMKRQLKSNKSLTYRNDKLENGSSFIINKLTKNLTNAQGIRDLQDRNEDLLNDSVELEENQKKLLEKVDDFDSKNRKLISNQRSTRNSFVSDMNSLSNERISNELSQEKSSNKKN